MKQIAKLTSFIAGVISLAILIGEPATDTSLARCMILKAVAVVVLFVLAKNCENYDKDEC